MSTPQPPPGFRIIPPEWLATHPLPGDAIRLIEDTFHLSGMRGSYLGRAARDTLTYATAEPLDCFKPTPDFRALCEEMRARLVYMNPHGPSCDSTFMRGRPCDCGLEELLTRANAALKGDE